MTALTCTHCGNPVVLAPNNPLNDVMRYLRRLEVDGDCWIYTGATDPGGYGRAAGGRLVHRLIWAWATGQALTADIVIRHSCDRPPCCRPSHLLAGTQADNIRDMHERGRAAPVPGLRGDQLPQAKLTAADVIRLRIDHAAGATTSVLAERYSITAEQVRNIVKRKQWAWLA